MGSRDGGVRAFPRVPVRRHRRRHVSPRRRGPRSALDASVRRAAPEAVLLPAQHLPAGCAPGGDRHGVQARRGHHRHRTAATEHLPRVAQRAAVAAGTRATSSPHMSKILALYKEAMPRRTRTTRGWGTRWPGRRRRTVITAMPGAFRCTAATWTTACCATGAKTARASRRRPRDRWTRLGSSTNRGTVHGDGGVLLRSDRTSRTRTWISLNRITIGLGSHAPRGAATRISRRRRRGWRRFVGEWVWRWCDLSFFFWDTRRGEEGE